MRPVRSAHATTVQVLGTDSSGDVVKLGANQSFHLHLR